MWLLLSCNDYKLEDLEKDPDGDQPDIVVEPEEVSFGTIELGCAAEATVRVSNVGLAALDVDGVSFVGDASMSAEVAPFSLDPGTSTTFQVRYVPVVSGAARADLQVSSDDPDEPVVEVPHGGAALVPEQLDRYVQRTPEVDVLWVIDNSGSMGEEQQRVIADITEFFAHFETLGLDYHMGVITTDIVDPTMGGRLQGSPTFITPETTNGIGELAEALQVGTEDMGDESGLAALQLALSEPVLSTENAGFLREAAQLVVVVLSDEPEHSGVAAAEYVTFLQGVKPDPSFLNVSAIVGDAGTGCKTTCDGAAQTAQPGDAYVEVSNAFPGVFGSICTCDLAAILSSIGLDSTYFTRSFGLSETPADATAIVVTVDGVVQTTGWTYDSGRNAVVFDLPPAGGQLVDLAYPTFPTCP